MADNTMTTVDSQVVIKGCQCSYCEMVAQKWNAYDKIVSRPELSWERVWRALDCRGLLTK